MPDYKEEQLTGKKWVRSDGFVGTNRYQELPTIRFTEEVRRELADGTIIVNGYGQGVSADLSDPLKILTLRHPLTDDVIGSDTFSLVHVVLYSLYRQLAIERDEKGIVPQEYPKGNSMGIIR